MKDGTRSPAELITHLHFYLPLSAFDYEKKNGDTDLCTRNRFHDFCFQNYSLVALIKLCLLLMSTKTIHKKSQSQSC